MRRILVLVGGYLPGYRAGGPIRSVANLVAALGDDFEWRILTRDHDLGVDRPYAGIDPGQWQTVGKARVMYLTKEQYRWSGLRHLLTTLDYDLLYLNSFFDSGSAYALMQRRLNLLTVRPTIVAPRGEFSDNALHSKRRKKATYLQVAKRLDLWHEITWHATSEHEVLDIRNVVGAPQGYSRIVMAQSLPSSVPNDSPQIPRSTKVPGSINIVFVSRIARIKNLSYALRLCEGIRGRVDFDIYGPIEDETYWRECQDIIDRISGDVHINYRGVLAHDLVPHTFARAHLFLLPTQSENYGHAIIEALAAGCLVMTSNQTPWTGLTEKMAGWDLPLSEPEAFRSALDQIVSMTSEEFQRWSEGARAFANRCITDPTVVDRNRGMFAELLGQR